jgi:hypothetical protein
MRIIIAAMWLKKRNNALVIQKKSMYINGLVFTDLGIGSVDASTGFVNETLPPLHNLKVTSHSLPVTSLP